VKIDYILTQVLKYFKKKVQKKQKIESENLLAASAPFLPTDENTHKK